MKEKKKSPRSTDTASDNRIRMTLKLDRATYLRLTTFAATSGKPLKSHQDVMHEALLEHLAKHGF